MELNKIYNENCLDTMARMPDDFIDLTVTSPPYDDLRKYKGYDFDAEAVLESLFRVTKPGGVVVWVVADRTVDGDETGTSFKHALYAKGVGFKLWDTMIFAKANEFPGDIGKRYRQSFDYMFAFVKGKEPKTFNPIQVPSANPGVAFSKARLERDGRNHFGGRVGNLVVEKTRDASNIFTYPVGCAIGSRKHLSAHLDHPAIFPEPLAGDQIRSWSNEGDLVYDPFTGSGTTAKMAYINNRDYIGSEISAEYAELARERIRKETEMPLFETEQQAV